MIDGKTLSVGGNGSNADEYDDACDELKELLGYRVTDTVIMPEPFKVRQLISIATKLTDSGVEPYVNVTYNQERREPKLTIKVAREYADEIFALLDHAKQEFYEVVDSTTGERITKVTLDTTEKVQRMLFE